MAHCKLTPQEFIQDAFSPMIAVLSTPGVDSVCQKNNLSFLELIRPFSKISTEGCLRDPSGTIITVKNLRLSFCDAYWRPPQPPVARTYFNDSVSSHSSERVTSVTVGSSKLEIPVSVPWYEAWRHTFFQVQFPSDHEFTKHYIACLLVVSTTDISPLERLAEIVEKFQSLMSEAPNKLPKWFGPSPLVLVSYLLLHDNSELTDNSKATFEAMKTTYGSNRCFFLRINSESPGSSDHSQLPDPWAQFLSTNLHFQEKYKENLSSQIIETAHEAGEKGSGPSTPVILHPLSPVTEDHSFISNEPVNESDQVKSNLHHGFCLTAEDITRIRTFINEYCLKALIPHFENQIQMLHDQISNKKGVSRSLLSATKRWFGTNKPGTPGNNIPPTAIAYSSDSHELQMRRLGDLCFMLGHYALAFTAYHSAKRDFGADGAWLHYAGALEMAALSAFMSNNEALSKKVIDYAEECITTYLGSCRMPQFATRATILSVECLKGKNLYGEAAHQLIRMTSEDSDLRSAVLLEQAAYCFLHSLRPTMHRKYAFHMVMAGHRYSKAGHKSHSIRCYCQAYQVYNNKWWNVAEDHINFTVGKQSALLKQSANAVQAFTLLVTRSSRQLPHQQQLFLKEFIVTIQQYEKDSGDIVNLAIPIIDSDNIQVLLGCPLSREISANFISATGITFRNNLHMSKATDESGWIKLEERLVACAQGANAMVFKPTIELFTKYTDNLSVPVVVMNEVVSMSIGLKNPLNISFKLRDLRLLWNLISDDSSIQNDTAVISEPIEEITLTPDATKFVFLEMTPTCVGELHITGLSYKLVDSVSGLEVFGTQSLTISSTNNKNNLGIDKRLELSVVDKAPHMQVSFSGLRDEVFCGEIMAIKVSLKNVGLTAISRVLLATTQTYTIWVEGQTELKKEPEAFSVIEIPLVEPLKTNQSKLLDLYVRSPLSKCDVNLDLLFYYEGMEKNNKIRYRLVRHTWPTAVYNYININSITRRSNLTSDTNDAINIQLHVSNTSDVNDQFLFKLFIDNISLYSAHWKLSNETYVPNDLKIERDETLMMMVQAVRQESSKENYLSTVFLTSNTSNSPYKYFIPRLPLQDDNPELNVICIINWMGEVTFNNGSMSEIFGQEHLTIKHITRSLQKSLIPTLPVFFNELDNSNKLNEIPLKERLISYQIQHPQTIKHSFNNSRLCVIPVQLMLQNCTNFDISLKVEAMNTYISLKDGPLVSASFIWMGQTVFNKDLKGFSTTSVPLLAATTCPGTFDLGSRLVVMAGTSICDTLQSCKPEAVLLVS